MTQWGRWRCVLATMLFVTVGTGGFYSSPVVVLRIQALGGVRVRAQVRGVLRPAVFGVRDHPLLRAFYYGRVIEIPTPRWTAYEAKRFGITLPREVPMATQERAYTSAIWYTPGK